MENPWSAAAEFLNNHYRNVLMNNFMLQFKLAGAGILLSSIMCASSIAAQSNDGFLDLSDLIQKEDGLMLDLIPDEKELTPFFEMPTTGKGKDIKANFENVLGLIKQNKLEEAQVKTTSLLDQNHEEAAYHNLQGLIYIQQQDQKKAIASFQQALKFDTKNLIAMLSQALLAIAHHDLSTAQEQLDRAIQTNPKAAYPYLLKASIAYRQNKPDEVENILSSGLKQAEGNLYSELLLTKNLVKLNELKQQPIKNLELVEALAQQYPKDIQVLSLLARVQIVNGEFAKAEHNIKAIIDQNDQDIVHRLLLAQVMMSRNEDLHAIESLIDETLKVAPKNIESQTVKTIFLIHSNRFEEAMSLAKDIDTQFSQSAVGKKLKADVSYAQQNYEQALTYNQEAYRIEPSPKLMTQIAGLLVGQGKNEEAIRFLNQELKKIPGYLPAHFQLANLYLIKQDYVNAEAHFQIILKTNPEDPVILNNLAMVYYYQNNAKALDLVKKAFLLAPDVAAIADSYGIISLKYGQKNEALSVLQKAVVMAPDALDIQFHLAQAYHANGDTQNAIATLEKIVASKAEFNSMSAAQTFLQQLRNE